MPLGQKHLYKTSSKIKPISQFWQLFLSMHELHPTGQSNNNKYISQIIIIIIYLLIINFYKNKLYIEI